MANYGARFDYRWARGTNIALSALNNVENQLNPRNGNYRVIIRLENMIDLFPIRTVTIDNSERGDGDVSGAWILALSITGYEWVLANMFTSATTVSEAMTIYTKLIRQGSTYYRKNCKVVCPTPNDLITERDNLKIVRFRLLGLTDAS